MGKQQEIDKRRKRAEGLYVSIEDSSKAEVQATVRGPSGRTWNVFFRGEEHPANYCDCPDFATNGLGTCKHLEALSRYLHTYNPDVLEELDDAPNVPVLYLDHRLAPRAIRIQGGAAAVPEPLAALFDDSGVLPEGRIEDVIDLLSRHPDSCKVMPEARVYLERMAAEARARQSAGRLAAQVHKDKKLATQPQHVREGVAFLLQKGRALLVDDFGLDRPGQAAWAVGMLTRAGLVQRCVVFCPETRRRHWQQLLIRRTGKRVSLVAGRTLVSSDGTFSSYPFLVTSYKDAAHVVDRISSYEPDLVILDEAHRIRRWNGPAAQAIKAVQAPLVFALSAPSVLRDPQQLYYLVQYLSPTLLGPPWRFDEEYLVRNEYGTVVDFQKVDKLAAQVSPLLLQRERSSLGAKTAKERIIVDPTTAQRSLMASPSASILSKMKDSRHWSQTDRAEIVAFLARLRKLANMLGAGLRSQGSPKASELLEIAKQIPHGGDASPILVFTRFRDSATALVEFLEQEGWHALAVTLPSQATVANGLEAGKWPDVVVVCDAMLDRIQPIEASAAFFLDVPWTPATVKARRKACRFVKRPGIEVELILADSLEEVVRRVLVTNTQVLAESLSDFVQELEALPSSDPAGLDKILDLVLDPHVLRSVVPANMPITHGMSLRNTGAARKRSTQRISGVRPIAQSGQRRDDRFSSSGSGIGDIVVLSLATRESLNDSENGGGMALAVTYSFRQDNFTGWKREFVGHLIRLLNNAALVVGWSPRTREYPVLAGYTGRNLTRLPTVGLLDEVQRVVGLHIPENLLVQGTLERRRRFDDHLAVQLWKHQRVDDLAQLLYEDVRLLRDLFVVAMNEGKLYYPSGPLGQPSEAILALSDRVPDAVASVVRRSYRT